MERYISAIYRVIGPHWLTVLEFQKMIVLIQSSQQWQSSQQGPPPLYVLYLNEGSNSSWNDDQETRLLVHQIQEHHRLTETPPHNWRRGKFGAKRWKAGARWEEKRRDVLTSSCREANHWPLTPPEADVILEGQKVKQELFTGDLKTHMKNEWSSHVKERDEDSQ